VAMLKKAIIDEIKIRRSQAIKEKLIIETVKERIEVGEIETKIAKEIINSSLNIISNK